MRGGRGILVMMVLAIAIGAGWWFASPWWTLRQMRAAADAHDGARLSAFIDYPALREDLKGELNQAMAREMARNRQIEVSPFAAALAAAFAGPMIDALVTPDRVEAMFAQRAAAGPAPATSGQNSGVTLPSANQRDRLRVERQGLNDFRLVTGKGEGAMQFHRAGLGWKLVGVDLPHGALPAG
ncbi:MAG: DUF2939 domain-containing protein [Sphingomicrobium sp.]